MKNIINRELNDYYSVTYLIVKILIPFILTGVVSILILYWILVFINNLTV